MHDDVEQPCGGKLGAKGKTEESKSKADESKSKVDGSKGKADGSKDEADGSKSEADGLLGIIPKFLFEASCEEPAPSVLKERVSKAKSSLRMPPAPYSMQFRPAKRAVDPRPLSACLIPKQEEAARVVDKEVEEAAPVVAEDVFGPVKEVEDGVAKEEKEFQTPAVVPPRVRCQQDPETPTPTVPAEDVDRSEERIQISCQEGGEASEEEGLLASDEVYCIIPVVSCIN